jgi:hypothetical protein
MAILIEDIRIKDKFRPSATGVDWLLASVGEPIDIEIDFRVEEVVIAQSQSISDSGWIILNPSSAVSDVADTNGLIYADNPLAFENFFVGDTITIVGAFKTANNGTYTVTEKIDNQRIRVNTSFQSSFVGTNGKVYVVTPFRGVRYFHNFIENDGATTFNDLTTNEQRLFKIADADNTNVTPKNMVFNGLKDYQIGGATIQGNGTSTYGQKFTIKHSTIVTPLFLESQYADLLLRVKPEYYEAGNCLKHIFQIECNRDLSNPNDNQIVLFDEKLGNTGWFDENYNGGTNGYTVSNVQITRVSDSASVNALELTNACDITFRVTNTSAFSNTLTKGMATFWQLPQQNNYVSNARNLQENFVYDYALQTIGAATVGGTYGVAIDEFVITYVDASNIDVRIRTSIDITSQGYINENTDKRYLVGFIVEKHSLTRETSDKVHLLINVNDFSIQLFDTELISNDTVFLQHRFSDVADGFASVDVFPTDDVVAYSQFNIDFNGLESDGINIVSVAHELVFKKSGFAEILVESNSVNTLTSVFLNGYVPLIDVEQNRAFKLSDGDFRKLITVDRDSANDSGTIFAYKTTYPFITRWEYWEALSGVNNPPSGVFDSTLPNNGINHYWHRYQTQGYTLNYRLRFTILQNGEQFTQEFDSPLVTRPFNDNAEWGNESIKSYDLSSVELVAGGVKFLQTGAKTKVVASFEKVSGTPPDVADVDIVFWGIVKEKGTIQSVVRYSSVYSNNGSTWFSSTDNSNLVVKSKVGAVYTGEVLVDNTLLPSASDFTIYARLYDAPPFGCPSNGIATESPECILTEDNFNLITEA